MKHPKFTDLILFEDDDIIVVNKPPFISSLDEREGGEVNMLRLAKAYTPDAQICHRLDKETSGMFDPLFESSHRIGAPLKFLP